MGIDIAEGQVSAAKRAAEEQGFRNQAEFQVGDAHNTGLEADFFDLVTAGQCWHWFDSVAAMAEARRVLRSGGALVIAHYSYLAEHSPVARDTEALVLEFNSTWPKAGESGIYPELIDEVIRGGFQLVEQFCFQEVEEFSHDRWRGRVRTCNGVGSGGLSPEDVALFDTALERLLQERYPQPLLVEHRVWCVVARKPQ